jgi:hypothetical protein
VLFRSVNAADGAAEAARAKIAADKRNAETAAQKLQETAAEAYARAREASGYDSLKRGLARSSIAVNKIAELDGGEARERVRIADELARGVAELDGEITALDVKRQIALNDFIVAYAAKLTAAINDLKTERDARRAEALKYNNTLTEKEHSGAVDKQVKESDLYSEALSQREKADKASADYAGAYAEMRAMLQALPADRARKALVGDPVFRDNLNDYYYYRLYDEFLR